MAFLISRPPIFTTFTRYLFLPSSVRSHVMIRETLVQLLVAVSGS